MNEIIRVVVPVSARFFLLSV